MWRKDNVPALLPHGRNGSGLPSCIAGIGKYRKRIGPEVVRAFGNQLREVTAKSRGHCCAAR